MTIVERLVRLAEESEVVEDFSIIVGGVAKIDRDNTGQIRVGPPGPRELGVPPNLQLPPT